MSIGAMLLVVLAQVPAARDAGTPECRSVPAHLEGRLTFRGDAWSIRLRAPAAGGDTTTAATGEIDIPDLLMAARPVPVKCEENGMVVELPFGFGEVVVRAASEGESWAGSALLGGDSLRMELSASPGLPYSVEDVTIASDDVRLNGQLFLPHGAELASGVVVVHGSGGQGLNMLEYCSWGDFYARLGVATLVYDKRGVGGSTGDFSADSAFDALTRDALAAVEFLRARPGVNPAAVGIAGHSQAGWIAFQAAARSPAVAFVALLAGPTVSVAEQELHRVRYGMEREGLSPEAVRAAVAHTRLLFSVTAAPAGWDALARSNASISTQPWADWVHRPEAAADLRWWRTHAGVDPEPHIRSLRIPIFAAYSLDDPVVPALQNAGLLREWAAANPGSDITVLTVEGGNHRLELPAGRRPDGRWYLPRVHPAFIQGLQEWVRWRWETP